MHMRMNLKKILQETARKDGSTALDGVSETLFKTRCMEAFVMVCERMFMQGYRLGFRKGARSKQAAESAEKERGSPCARQ